ENLIRALLIFNGLRSRYCQRALLGYHYPKVDVDVERLRRHRYTTASKPFCSIRLRSFKAIPVGRFFPISHFCTVDRLVLRHAAKTAWLTWARLRIWRISSGASACTGLRHTLSKSRMVMSDTTPAAWRPRAVSCTSLRIRDCAIGYLLQL